MTRKEQHVSLHAWTHVRRHVPEAWTCVCTCPCMHGNVCGHVSAHMDTCVCACPCTHGHMCMQTYIPQRKVCAPQRLLLFDLFLSSPSGSLTVTLWQAPYSCTKRFASSIFIDFQSLWIVVALNSLNALGFEHRTRFVVLSIPRCSGNPKAQWLTDHPLCLLPDRGWFSHLLSGFE